MKKYLSTGLLFVTLGLAPSYAYDDPETEKKFCDHAEENQDKYAYYHTECERELMHANGEFSRKDAMGLAGMMLAALADNEKYLNSIGFKDSDELTAKMESDPLNVFARAFGDNGRSERTLKAFQAGVTDNSAGIMLDLVNEIDN